MWHDHARRGRGRSVQASARLLARSKITGLNRAVAFGLVAVWLCAGGAGVYVGLGLRQFLPVACGVFAIAYALLWLRVAARSRLLSWREIVFPWRVH